MQNSHRCNLATAHRYAALISDHHQLSGMTHEKNSLGASSNFDFVRMRVFEKHSRSCGRGRGVLRWSQETVEDLDCLCGMQREHYSTET